MVKKILLLIAVIGLLQIKSFAAEIIAEAESGVRYGSTTVESSTSGYSGTGYVSGFKSSSDSVTVTVNIPKAGTYMLSIGYCTPYGEKTNYISVNGALFDTVYFAANSSFTELSCDKTISLKEGNNTITFISFWGWMLLDYFKIGGIGPKGNFTVTPANPAMGDTVVFDASAVQDPNGTVVGYNWNFGDGTSDNGMIAKHVYTQKGFFSVQLAATDNDGNQTKKSMILTVVDGAPTPLFSYSQDGFSRFVEFTSSSFDLNGSIVACEWDFGDDSTATFHSKTTSVTHTYAEYGSYPVKLTVTDNDGKKATRSTIVRVYDSSVKVRGIHFDTPTMTTYQKAEASFEINGSYSNPYDPDEIEADAIVKFGTDSMVVPCFYYEETRYNQVEWISTHSDKLWKVRFTPQVQGSCTIRIKVKDATGTSYSEPVSFEVSKGNQKGFIYVDTNDKQQFRRNTGEMYLPIGNNYPWTFSRSGSDRMAGIDEHLDSISKNGGNWIRYWFASFADQSLEWTGSDYSGLGKYNQMSAALLDSILNNCQEKEINMQLVFYHHGMFSQTVDAEWSSNPYNVSNGGILDNPTKFFTDASALKYAKRLARYVVARWGYSQNIFNWELFNEVNFTGTNSNNTAQKTNIANWHDAMSQYIKSIDPYQHLITSSTSGDNELLTLMNRCNAMDLLEFHVYDNDPITAMNTQIKTLQKSISKPLLCGEFGIGSSATVSNNLLRKIIWNSYMHRVPAFYWYWDETLDYGQHRIYQAISKLFSDEDPLVDLDSTMVTPATYKTSSTWFTAGKHGKKTWYGFVSASEEGNQTGGIYVNGLDYGYYKAVILDAENGDTLQTKEVPIIDTDVKLPLPAFNSAVAIKLSYDSPYTMPIAIAGADQIKFYENTFTIDGSTSVDPSGKQLTYSWSVVNKPQSSSLTLKNPAAASFDVEPDLSGYYSFRLVVSNAIQTSVADTVTIWALPRPVANAGANVDTLVKKAVILDGNSSYDPSGFPLTFSWTIASMPDGSTTTIASPATAKPKVRPTVPGTYIVTLVVDNGYAPSLPDTVIITASYPDGVNVLTNNLSIYPNPASERLMVTLPSGWDGETTFTFTDIAGKKLFSTQKIYKEGNVSIELPSYLNEGVYFLRAVCGSKKATAKLIIKK